MCPTGELPATTPRPCILIVEDDGLLAMLLEGVLDDLGYCSVLAACISDAAELIATTALDGAILDLNLDGTEVYPVADELRHLGIPFVFSTGYGPEDLRPDYRSWPVLTKPYLPRDLGRILTATVGARLGQPGLALA
jgi:CheY-like chemotaxis protein